MGCENGTSPMSNQRIDSFALATANPIALSAKTLSKVFQLLPTLVDSP